MARFPSMTINPAGEARERSWWVYTLLGVVLLFAGAFGLANLVFASAVSAIWIASAIIVAGVYQYCRRSGAGAEGVRARYARWHSLCRGRRHVAPQSATGVAEPHFDARHHMDFIGTGPRLPGRGHGQRPPGFHALRDGQHHCWSRHPLPMACLRTLGLGSLPWRRPYFPRDRLDRILVLGSRRSASPVCISDVRRGNVRSPRKRS